jgi:hypothetical protein
MHAVNTGRPPNIGIQPTASLAALAPRAAEARAVSLLLYMCEQQEAVIANHYLKVLEKIMSRLEDKPIAWVVTGSLGMALQGVPVQVHDIDIQTDRDGAYEIERCLAEYVVEPVRYSESERIRSHFGMVEIDGIKVEIMGDIQKHLSDGGWEKPVKVERYRRWVEVGGMRIPVLLLEYEYQAYLKLGRNEKAEILRLWLQRQKRANKRFQPTPTRRAG